MINCLFTCGAAVEYEILVRALSRDYVFALGLASFSRSLAPANGPTERNAELRSD